MRVSTLFADCLNMAHAFETDFMISNMFEQLVFTEALWAETCFIRAAANISFVGISPPWLLVPSSNADRTGTCRSTDMQASVRQREPDVMTSSLNAIAWRSVGGIMVTSVLDRTRVTIHVMLDGSEKTDSCIAYLKDRVVRWEHCSMHNGTALLSTLETSRKFKSDRLGRQQGSLLLRVYFRDLRPAGKLTSRQQCRPRRQSSSDVRWTSWLHSSCGCVTSNERTHRECS